MADHRQWEYYVETAGSAWKGLSDEELGALLAELGQSGWDVLSVEQMGTGPKVRIVAKRPVASGASKRQGGWP
jgi:hypothetical protein